MLRFNFGAPLVKEGIVRENGVRRMVSDHSIVGGRMIASDDGQSEASGCGRRDLPRAEPREFSPPAFPEARALRRFSRRVEECLGIVPMRILAYCLMPNHWHLVLDPRADGDLSKFLPRIALTLTPRYHAKSRTVVYGRVYQGRYKSLPVERGGHFLTLVR